MASKNGSSLKLKRDYTTGFIPSITAWSESQNVLLFDNTPCGHACDWVEPYGFVPEADCPEHDKTEFIATVTKESWTRIIDRHNNKDEDAANE